MADLDDQNDQHRVLDLVNDVVVSHADTIKVLIPGELDGPARARVLR